MSKTATFLLLISAESWNVPFLLLQRSHEKQRSVYRNVFLSSLHLLQASRSHFPVLHLELVINVESRRERLSMAMTYYMQWRRLDSNVTQSSFEHFWIVIVMYYTLCPFIMQGSLEATIDERKGDSASVVYSATLPVPLTSTLSQLQQVIDSFPASCLATVRDARNGRYCSSVIVICWCFQKTGQNPNNHSLIHVQSENRLTGALL